MVQKNIDDGYLDEVRLRFDSPVTAPHTVPWRVQIHNTPTLAKNAMWQHGAYANDQIRVPEIDVIHYSAAWGPHVGIAYDLLGNGKNVIKATT